MDSGNRQDPKASQRKPKNKKKSKSALKQEKMRQKKNPPIREATISSAADSILTPEIDTGKENLKDIHVPNYTMMRPGGGPELLNGTDLQLTYGRKYGLIGKNGHGKTTLLTNIASGKIMEIPRQLHILHIKQEMPSGGKSVIDTVLSSDLKRHILLKEEKQLLEAQKTLEANSEQSDEIAGRLQDVYEGLNAIDAASAGMRAAVILKGLQFTEEMHGILMNDLSGGWRMRVSLACALFAAPDLLLLDEPTNHLDFPAVKWLSNYLKKHKKTLVVVSHDRKFLNDVCTDIIHIEDSKLKYYKGDYESFERVRTEHRKQAKTAYDKQQATIEHNMDFIRRFRANKKLASLAQSRMKVINNMVKLEDVKADSKFFFKFPTPKAMKKNEVLLIDEMSFGYKETEEALLYHGVNLRLHLGGVVGVFGRNGTGKSTLINIILGNLKPSSGTVELNPNAVIGYFAQHHEEMLDLDLSPYELLLKEFPTTKHQEIYQKLGQFNLAKNCADKKIGLLSGGEKSRLSFALVTWNEPQLLIMDEPTNHLDIETIDGLIEAIKTFQGAVLLISHDEHFLTSVCSEYWAIGRNKKIRDFHDFEKGKKFSYQ